MDIETPEKRQKVDVFSCAAGFEPVVFRKRDGDGWSAVREDPKCGNAQTAEGFVGFLRALPERHERHRRGLRACRVAFLRGEAWLDRHAHPVMGRGGRCYRPNLGIG